MRPFHHLVPRLAERGRIAVTRDELVSWGEAFGRAVRPPLFVALAGDLGSGKTTLAQAICRGYGVAEPVTSPTYTIVHQYQGTLSEVFHIDLYRLAGEQDLPQIGWDDIVTAHALVLVEWPERAGERIPLEHVPVDLAHAPGDDDRRILLAG